jgi:hypothetical protein
MHTSYYTISITGILSKPMSVLDLKRTKADFLKKKGRSSEYTLRSYENIFRHIERFCLEKLNFRLDHAHKSKFSMLYHAFLTQIIPIS